MTDGGVFWLGDEGICVCRCIGLYEYAYVYKDIGTLTPREHFCMFAPLYASKHMLFAKQRAVGAL